MEEEGYIGVGTLADLRGDADVGDGRPGVEEVIQELHEICLTYSVLLSPTPLLLLRNHLERDACLVGITAAFQDLHVLDEVLEVDLRGGGDTCSSLSRSKALNMRSEKSWAQCNPSMPIFFLKD